MKITKYLLGIALLSLGISMTSCDKENEGAVFDSSFNNVSWGTNKVDIVTDDSEVEVPVKITRTHKDGSLTVNYNVKANAAGVFSDDCNGKVTFANGEVIKYVNIKAKILEKGKKYTYTMTFDDAAKKDIDGSYSRMLTQEVTISVLGYTWVDAGTCTFVDANFYEDYAYVSDVPVVRALESKDPYIFRIIKPYQALTAQPDYQEDAEYFANAGNIEFYLKEDGSPDYVIEDIFISNDYSYSYFTDGGYAGYCKFTYKNGVYTVNNLISVGGEPTYLGAFFFIWEAPDLTVGNAE